MIIEEFHSLEQADNFIAQLVTEKTLNDKAVLISGGNTFLNLLQILSSKKKQLKFFLTDERDVGKNSEDSNLWSYQKLQYTNMHFMGFIPSKNYKKAISLYNQIIPSDYFDLALIGVGTDGHIASIFPNENNLIFKSKNSFYCESSLHQHKRYSLSLNYIKKSRMIILYFRGDEKIKAFEQFFNIDSFPLNELLVLKNNLIVIKAKGQ